MAPLKLLIFRSAPATITDCVRTLMLQHWRATQASQTAQSQLPVVVHGTTVTEVGENQAIRFVGSHEADVHTAGSKSEVEIRIKVAQSPCPSTSDFEWSFAKYAWSSSICVITIFISIMTYSLDR